MANPPRKHHYTPVLLLRRFTDADEVLYVVSREKGHRYVAAPKAVGFENDFYTLEEVAEGEDPQLVEKAFAEFEGKASAVLDVVIANQSIPEDPEKFNTLMNFIAFSAARIPAMRQLISKPLEDIAQMILQMNLSSEAQFKDSFKEAGIDVDAVGLTYEKAKETVNNLTIRVTTAAYIRHMNTVVNILLPLLAQRNWCVLYNDAQGPHLIVTDNPVGISWSDATPRGFFGPAFGMPGTDVTIPLSSHVALLGCFEVLPPVMEMDAHTVAVLNTKTLGGCQRFIAAASADFTCTNQSGDIVTDKELIEHLKRLKVEKK